MSRNEAQTRARLVGIVLGIGLSLGGMCLLAEEDADSTGCVHVRHYRLTTSIPDIPGRIEFDDTKCFTPIGNNEFTVQCDGTRGPNCSTNGLVTGRFTYEGVTKTFAIPVGNLCRCDNLHHPTCPCGDPSLCDGCDTTTYGQDEYWVRANFDLLRDFDTSVTNAGEIISRGYADWVDGRVGVGLTNGLYKLTATFTNAPSEAVRLEVGDYKVVVTNAGSFVFLLKKGIDYFFDTYPRSTEVCYSAQDDLMGAPLFAAPLRSGGNLPGAWTVDGGEKILTEPDGNDHGHVLQMPTLTATPDVTHLSPEDFPVTFTAVLTDIPQGTGVEYDWNVDTEYFDVSAPEAQEMTVDIRCIPSWREGSISVTASFLNKGLTSFLNNFTYGSNSEPQMTLSLSPGHIWVNQPIDDRNKRVVTVRFASDIPTNGMVYVTFLGDPTRLALANSTWNWTVNPVMHMSQSDPQIFELGIAEGLVASDSVSGEKFECRFEGSDGAYVVTNAITVARVASVDLWSARGGVSANPPPFPGQCAADFCITNSAAPDKHYPIFFHDVVDHNIIIQPYSVEYRVNTIPVNFTISEAETVLRRISGPVSGTLRGSVGKTGYFDTPGKGGVYKMAVSYDDSPATETVLVLPIAGASVDDVVLADRARADSTAAYIIAHYSPIQRQRPGFGLQWFNNDGMGDYLGRVDSTLNPTVWPYNQVNDRTGMGAVATWRGLPIRMAKVSNFLVGYTTRTIGVWRVSRALSQRIGTGNDASASLSWDAGVALAEGADYDATVGAMVTNAWKVSDEKEKRLWPNPSPADNHTSRMLLHDFNYDFISPGFTERRP